jgi:hypothetical protein
LAVAVAALLLSDTLAVAENPVAGANSETAPQRDPGFSVIPRRDKLFFYPCADCHEFLESNTEIRSLDTEPDHPAELEHGAGEVWCTSCHSQSPYDSLHTLLGEEVGYDESHRVCGGCHSHKLRDWKYGAHGKRVANWHGERRLYGCPECHNPHRPEIAPRPALPPPQVRTGLKRVDGHAARQPPIWEAQSRESVDE